MDPIPEDEKLIALLVEQPERAIELIFRKYYPVLVRRIARVVADDAVAEDLAQDVFYDLWRKRETIHVRQSLGAYLSRAATNKALNFIRDQKWAAMSQEPEPIPSNRPGALAEMEAEDLQQIVDRAIDDLPERCRVVFVLRRFEEMSHQEIADRLDISVKTVENQITKAQRLLREALRPYLG